MKLMRSPDPLLLNAMKYRGRGGILSSHAVYASKEGRFMLGGGAILVELGVAEYTPLFE